MDQLTLVVFIHGYENRLKDMNPTVRNLRYETKDLMNYIDNLPDLGVLTYDHSFGTPICFVFVVSMQNWRHTYHTTENG